MSTSRTSSDVMRRRRPAPPTMPASRTQSFSCSADLLRAFEQRAFELGCSFDWLLEEAMQRLLVEANEANSREPSEHASSKPLPPASREPLPPASRAPVEPASGLLPLPGALPTRAAASTVPPPPPTRTRLAPPPPPPPLPAAPSPSQVFSDGDSVVEPLVLYSSGDEQLVIDRHPFVIGRSAIMADLVIEDGEVSRRHAVIEHTAKGWVITDLGSTNGIVVDGEVVRHAVLRAGMVMSIGPMAFGIASPA
jgi:hypothetical protein